MNASNDNIYAIILAGGASSRLGKPKQLLKWQNQSLLGHAIQNVRALLNERIIVVLGAHAELIQSAVDLDGITPSSIQTGRQALLHPLKQVSTHYLHRPRQCCFYSVINP